MLTVVWDVDDILNDLMFQWFQHGWLPEHPDCRLSYAELTCNPPDAVLGVSRNEYFASIDRFRRTDRGCNMIPNPDVLGWFREEGQRFRHIALTARPLDTVPDVAHWVMRHFGGWIRCFGVLPTRLEEGFPVYDRSKGEYLRWIRTGDIFVDDADENIAQAQSLGVKTLQIAQPWNKSTLSIAEMLSQLSVLGAGN